MRALIGVLLLAISSWCLAVPKLLIVEIQVADEDGRPISVPIATALSEHLREAGRVDPIVWSMTDSRFREATESGLIPVLDRNPERDEMLSVAAKLEAAYVLECVVTAHEGKVYGNLALLRGGREVWSDNKVMDFGSGFDSRDNAVLTLARTWNVLLEQEPFRNLEEAPMLETPQIEPGELNPEFQPEVQLPPNDPNALASAQTLLADGRFADAIALLRGAVDRSPFDLDLRRLLVDALVSSGMLEAGAIQARLAAQIADEPAEFYLAASRAWMALGRADEAKQDVNEALARNAGGEIPDLVLGEIHLAEGRYAESAEAFSKAIRENPTSEAYVGRAIACAMLGDAAQVREDLAKVGFDNDRSLLTRYRFAMSQLQPALDQLADQLRDGLARGQTRRGDPEMIQHAAQALALAESLAALVEGFPVPEGHKRSHTRRDLAHKLLMQSAGECLAFVRSGGDDLRLQATLSLGDALEHYTVVRAEFEAETASALGSQP